MRRLAASLGFVVLVTAASARAAEPTEGSAAAAESLFQDGRRLMDAKKYAEACPKFLASHKMAPAVGTLLNLADCYEREGRIASAWARFHEAVGLAQRLGRPDREKTAKDRADKLEPRLIKVAIKTEEKRLTVKLDGTVIEAEALGSPVPVDPGKHTIEASAKGKRPYTSTFDVGERAKTTVVEIPPLDADPDAKVAEAPPPPPKKTDDGAATVSTKPGGTQRTIGIVMMGVGAVGLGVGAFFGLKTSATWSDAKGHCEGGECDATGVDLADSARASGNLSTIAFIAGGAFALGGLAVFFTAPSDRSPRAVIGPGTVAVGGRF